MGYSYHWLCFYFGCYRLMVFDSFLYYSIGHRWIWRTARILLKGYSPLRLCGILFWGGHCLHPICFWCNRFFPDFLGKDRLCLDQNIFQNCDEYFEWFCIHAWALISESLRRLSQEVLWWVLFRLFLFYRHSRLYSFFHIFLFVDLFNEHTICLFLDILYFSIINHILKRLVLPTEI